MAPAEGLLLVEDDAAMTRDLPERDSNRASGFPTVPIEEGGRAGWRRLIAVKLP
jgi:hypothetical protein